MIPLNGGSKEHSYRSVMLHVSGRRVFLDTKKNMTVSKGSGIYRNHVKYLVFALILVIFLTFSPHYRQHQRFCQTLPFSSRRKIDLPGKVGFYTGWRTDHGSSSHGDYRWCKGIPLCDDHENELQLSIISIRFGKGRIHIATSV